MREICSKRVVNTLFETFYLHLNEVGSGEVTAW